MVKADFITGIVLIGIGVYVIIESWRMPRLEHLQVHPLSVPGLVPAFLAVVIIVFATQLVLRSINKGGHRLGLKRETFGRIFSDPGNQRLLLTAVVCMVYACLLVGMVPYWLATGLFVFGFILMFEWKESPARTNRWRSAVIALILAGTTSAAVTWVFEKLFLVTLP